MGISDPGSFALGYSVEGFGLRWCILATVPVEQCHRGLGVEVTGLGNVFLTIIQSHGLSIQGRLSELPSPNSSQTPTQSPEAYAGSQISLSLGRSPAGFSTWCVARVC